LAERQEQEHVFARSFWVILEARFYTGLIALGWSWDVLA